MHPVVNWTLHACFPDSPLKSTLIKPYRNNYYLPNLKCKLLIQFSMKKKTWSYLEHNTLEWQSIRHNIQKAIKSTLKFEQKNNNYYILPIEIAIHFSLRLKERNSKLKAKTKGYNITILRGNDFVISFISHPPSLPTPINIIYAESIIIIYGCCCLLKNVWHSEFPRA